MNKPRISIIGLGKLGVPLVAAHLLRGFSVIGMDIDTSKVNGLKAALSLPDKPDAILEATSSTTYAILNSDITIIIVNTPQDIDGPFSLKYILPACESIGAVLREKEDYHLVVLSSTVMPGTTGGIVLDVLEKASGKKCGEDFGLCHWPEFLALGTAISNLLRPDFLLIGEHDRRSGNILIEALLHLCENNPPVIRTSLVNAELSKLAHNCFLITKISFANHWAAICEGFSGADIDAITSVLGLSSNISPRYLKGSISGVEGPCFPRDIKAWLQLTKQADVSDDLPYSTDDANWFGTHRLARIIRANVAPRRTIGILGLAYKPGIDLTLNSLGKELAKVLPIYGFSVIVYDPMAMPDCLEELSATFADSLEECVAKSECLVITTAWDEFRQLESMFSTRRDKIIIDCWRMLDGDIMGDNYIAIGRGK